VEPLGDGHVGEWAVGVDVEARSLCVRNWRVGDRFRPLGLNGHRKKLQDLFVDRKIGRPDRHRVPVVLDDRDRVIWVVGLGLSDDFRVTGATTSMVILRVRPLGDKL
jgi:tRNA(Ile)-lysidine synthase